MVFGFGKKASAASHGGGDDTYRQQPPHIRRLIDAMQVIFDDASKLADTIRRGKSLPSSTPTEPHLSPIRCGASETLFEHVNENGEKQYTTYHFTKDLKTINAAAQYYLYVMYGRIYFANVLADKLSNGGLSDGESTELKNAIDEVLAKSAYYINYFRGYAFSTAALMMRISDEDVPKRMHEHAADWASRMDEAKRAMFRPERLVELVPDRQFALLIAASGPYQEGQAVINGVVFAPEHAGPLLKSMADEQAKAITARQLAEQRRKA
jgi:hypothetical protein